MKLTIITAIYLLCPILIASLFVRYKFIQKVGTVIIAYAIGIIMALTGFIKFEDPVQTQTLSTIQTWIMNLSVPLAIPLMLFSCDFKLWTKSLPKTFLSLIGGVSAVVVAIISAFFIFRNQGIENLNNVAGMMTGIYTGGTLNFYALGSALKVEPTIITFVYTFEMLVTFPLIMFIVGGGYKFFRKLMPFKDESTTANETEVRLHDIEDYGNMLRRRTLPKTLLGLLISIVFLAIGAGLSFLITGKLHEMIIILTITTLAIIASFFKPIRELPKTFELGMIFILMFSIVVASQFDISVVNYKALPLLFFVLYIMLIAVTLHILFCKIAKVNGDLFTVSITGLLCSPPFIPPVVSAIGNKKVLISGIVVGLVGYAIGTYLGIGIASLLSLF
ncbi:MAG: DUF819 family protein [Bacteroidales bacterium]|nr:DUF819 family protein [Bacteroidales bacterium]MBR5720629.1 DUF819 family protein [Bacteroidales bacterium]